MHKQGWEPKSVSENQKDAREENRKIRARQRAIGRELRRVFDDVVEEPVPDEFLSLLKKIDERAKNERSDHPEKKDR
jgi:urease accessory protein UreF